MLMTWRISICFFDPVRNVAVIGIKLIARIVIGFKLLVVLGNIAIQLIPPGPIDLARNIRRFSWIDPFSHPRDDFIRSNAKQFEQSPLLFVLLLFFGLDFFKQFKIAELFPIQSFISKID